MSDLNWPSTGEPQQRVDSTLNFSFTQLTTRPSVPIRNSATSKAAGKVILVGEHAVVYGAKALAIPLLSKTMNLRIYTDKITTPTPLIKFQIGGKQVQPQLIEMVIEAFDVLGIPKFNLSIDGHSNLMLGAGVGSSAALCVSVLRGLAQVCGVILPPAKLAQMANKLERRFHGNPSGLDTAVVSLEQAIVFERGHDAEAIVINRPKNSHLPWCFALLDTSVRSPTINMVKLAQPWFASQGNQAVEKFNNVTSAAVSALLTGDIDLMKDAMTSAHELLDETGIVNDPVKSMIDLAFKFGAKAAKVTGAGGGGCVLALFDAGTCDHAMNALRHQLGAARVLPIFIP